MKTPAFVPTGAAHYAEHARGWLPGTPLPVIAGPELDRFQALLDDLALTPGPIGAVRTAGAVVSVGSPVAAAAASLLAAATGREHHHAPADHLRDVLDKFADAPVALVGVAYEFAGAGSVLYTRDRTLGLVTARTQAGLTALVLRTLLAPAVLPDTRYTVSSVSLHASEQADAVSVDEAAELRARHTGTLVLRTHGRECAAILSDGVLCGRSDPVAPLPFTVTPPGSRRTTSCMRGGGCFFEDVEEENRVPAAEIRAGIVLSQACMTVSVGVNEYPDEIGLGLGFLDGVSIAERAAVRELYETCPPGGQSAGELLAELNRLGHSLTGGRPEFVLLGDPAVRLPVSAPAHPEPAAREYREYAVPPRLTELHQEVLPRLERLQWLGTRDQQEFAPLRDELRGLIRHALRWGPGTVELDPVEQRTAAAHLAVLESFTETAYEQHWDFKEGVLPGLETRSAEEIGCPACGRPQASRLLLRHRVDSALELESLSCAVCADLLWSTEPSGELRTGLPGMTLGADGRLEIRWDVRNTSDTPRTVHAGFGFLLGAKRGLPKPRPVTLRVGANASAAVRLEVTIPEQPPVRLEYGGMCVLVSEGHCHAAPVILG